MSNYAKSNDQSELDEAKAYKRKRQQMERKINVDLANSTDAADDYVPANKMLSAWYGKKRKPSK